MKNVLLKKKKHIPRLLWRSLQWHMKYYFTKKPMPLSCGFYLTSTCNLKCSFCNIWRKSGKPAPMPLEKAKMIIDNVRQLGCYYVSITGGEPLIVGYIFDLLSYAKRSGIAYLHMVTNGYLLDEDKAARLRDTGVDEISISIDGSPALHDKKRGVPGAYERAVKAITSIKKAAPDIDIVLNTIFFPDNPHECLHVVELAEQYDVSLKIQPENQHPIFNKTNNASISSRVDLASLEPDIKRVIDKLSRNSRVINSRAFLDNIQNFYFNKERLIFSGKQCLLGYHHIEILEDGTVFPCLEGMNWINGTVCKNNLKAVINSSSYIDTLTGLRDCGKCRENYYICYYEPRIVFPMGNFIRYGW